MERLHAAPYPKNILYGFISRPTQESSFIFLKKSDAINTLLKKTFQKNRFSETGFYFLPLVTGSQTSKAASVGLASK